MFLMNTTIPFLLILKLTSVQTIKQPQTSFHKGEGELDFPAFHLLLSWITNFNNDNDKEKL